MSFIRNAGKAMADVIPGLGRFTYDASMGTVFVTSGAGVIGYRVALSLLEAGVKDVRVGVWKGEQQQQQKQRQGSSSETATAAKSSFTDLICDLLRKKGATVVDFDWNDPDSFETAVNGVKTVFCTIPHMNNWADDFPAFLRMCKLKKVEHFIKVSFLRNSEVAEQYRMNVPFVKFHSTCDDLLVLAKNNSRISYTILACSHMMSTPLLHQGHLLTEEHKFITASYGMGVNYVSPNDVADAAMVVLMNLKHHRNKTYNLTGRGPIKDSDVSRLLSQKYGMPIEHIDLGYHEYKKDVSSRGLPDWLVKDSAEFERMKASGIDELPNTYTQDLKQLIGREPETFEDYLNSKTTMRPGMTFNLP